MITGLVTIIIVVSITVLFVHRRSAHKRTVALFHQLSCLGSQHDLSFTSQQRLRSCIIGLDGLNQRFLVMTHKNGNAGHLQVVSLADVKTCAVKQTFRLSESLPSSHNQSLEKIALFFEMNKATPVEIVFYHHLHNHKDEAPIMGERAKDWETILSKMCNRKEN